LGKQLKAKPGVPNTSSESELVKETKKRVEEEEEEKKWKRANEKKSWDEEDDFINGLNLLDESTRYLENEKTGHFWMCKNFSDQVLICFGLGDDYVSFMCEKQDEQAATDFCEELAGIKVADDGYIVKKMKKREFKDPIMCDDIEVLLARNARKIS